MQQEDRRRVRARALVAEVRRHPVDRAEGRGGWGPAGGQRLEWTVRCPEGRHHDAGPRDEDENDGEEGIARHLR